MSFLNHKTRIEEGDTIILYLNVNNLYAIDVLPNIKNKKGELIENVFQTHYGALKVKKLIGELYGTKVELSKGWAFVLQANPDLWTQTLPHRTQIIYTPDISMILFQLDIKPGSIVIESGTGSGSLSHYFLRAIKPHGHLHTFDFHENRVQQAREDFKTHGVDEFVTVYCRDVCELGFTKELHEKADAIFLDLPSPHVAIPHAVAAFKKSGGRFCSFSPCIEQSQRCCETLETAGFVDIHNMEILQAETIVKTKNIPLLDLEFVKHKKTTSDTENCDTDVIKNKWLKEKIPRETKKYLTASAPQSLPGHTGYLTFATFPPLFARARVVNE